jgi:hypothetical protein
MKELREEYGSLPVLLVQTEIRLQVRGHKSMYDS